MAATFNGESFKLKYLFGCTFENETYIQTDADMSLTNPDKSAFFDIKDKDIGQFWIFNADNQWLVDLSDGHFEINEIPFFMHTEQVTNFRLIYYRQHKHHFNQASEQVGHEIEYHFGWQGNNEKGENIQRIMVLR